MEHVGNRTIAQDLDLTVLWTCGAWRLPAPSDVADDAVGAVQAGAGALSSLSTDLPERTLYAPASPRTEAQSSPTNAGAISTWLSC